MKSNPKPWDRKLWGVVYEAKGLPSRSLLGCECDKYPLDPPRYFGESSRALTFRARYSAQQWCSKRNRRERYLKSGLHYRVVRVRELVEIIG